MIRFLIIVCLFLSSCAANNIAGEVYQLQVSHLAGHKLKCTAFLITPNIALTAGHCLWSCHHNMCRSQLLERDGEIRQIQFADYANVADYGSLIVSPKASEIPWEISEAPPKVGEKLCYTTARPGMEWTEHCGDVISISYGRAHIDVPIEKGTSGAPVYNTSDYVVGIAVEMGELDGKSTVAQLINPVITVY